MRPGYAIEYDCIDPLQLKPTLEFKNIQGFSLLASPMVPQAMRKLRLRA